MLILAHERESLYPGILQAVQGVLFMATPHNGSNIASMLSYLTGIATVASLGRTNGQLVQALKAQGNSLLEISEAFVERGNNINKIYSFFEHEALYGSIVCIF